MSQALDHKPTRGRPKGAISFVEMSAAEILEKVGGDMDTVIPVSRVWLSKQIAMRLASSSIKSESKEEQKIQFSIS